MMFKDRIEAGRLLSEKLVSFKRKSNAFVTGIPRGGMIVAFEVAKILSLPLDILVVQKIGAPFNSELAIGAVTSGGVVYWDESLCRILGVSREYQRSELRIKNHELKEKEDELRENGDYSNLRRKTVILIDDGVATGSTAVCASRAIRKQRPLEVVYATPVIAFDQIEKIRKEVDDLVYVDAPLDFQAVGQFYERFDQVSNEEVVTLLHSKNKSFYRKGVL